MSVYIFATLDTKGHEAAFVRAELERHGLQVTLVDTGCLGDPQVEADIDRAALFAEGDALIAELVARRDRGDAVKAAARGAESLARQAHAKGSLSGVIGLGGSAGTTIATLSAQRDANSRLMTILADDIVKRLQLLQLNS